MGATPPADLELPDGQLVVFFRPNNRWAQLHPGDVGPYLTDLDFKKFECDPEQLFIGRLGPELSDGDVSGLSQKAHEHRAWEADDPALWIVWLDWHGTPCYFYDRERGLNSDMPGFDWLDAAPLVDIQPGVAYGVVARLLEQKAALLAMPDHPATSTAGHIAPLDDGLEPAVEQDAPARPEQQPSWWRRLLRR
ncbi:MAG TPA: hypothetical protein VHG29_06605 [Novosphingobium sp.]|nr:hypothetical protein [Novosphingobium sp.]